MGMFDYVIADCPKCGAQVVFQSKGGECSLLRYHVSSVPPEVARYIVGESQICRCGEVIKLKLSKPIERVQMVLDVSSEWD